MVAIGSSTRTTRPSARRSTIDRPDFTHTTVGFADTADVRATKDTVSGRGTTARIQAGPHEVTFRLPMTRWNFVAAAFIALALAVGQRAGISLADGVAAIAAMPAPPGRARLQRLSPNILVIDDTYNASPDATLAALDLLDELPGTIKIAALGEM